MSVTGGCIRQCVWLMGVVNGCGQWVWLVSVTGRCVCQWVWRVGVVSECE